MGKYIFITTALVMIFAGSFSQKCNTTQIPSQKQSDSTLNAIISNSYKDLKRANDTLKNKQIILYKKLDSKMSNKR